MAESREKPTAADCCQRRLRAAGSAPPREGTGRCPAASCLQRPQQLRGFWIALKEFLKGKIGGGEKMQKGREGPGEDGEKYAAIFDNKNRGASEAPRPQRLTLCRAGDVMVAPWFPWDLRAGAVSPRAEPGCWGQERSAGVPTPSVRAQRGAGPAPGQLPVMALDFLWARWHRGCAGARCPRSGAGGWKRRVTQKCCAGPGPLALNHGHHLC